MGAEGRRTSVWGVLNRAALLSVLTSLLGTAVLSVVLAMGATAVAALTGPVAPVDATCTGWPSSGGVTASGHHYYDFNTASGTWSTGPTEVALPSSYTCSSWLRTYRYNALTVNNGYRWYWIKSSGTFGAYMNTTAGTTASFPVQSSGIAQNTTYGFGVGYGSCSTDYGSAVGWITGAAPGANCGTPAVRYPDSNGPKYDWTAPGIPQLLLPAGSYMFTNAGTAYFTWNVPSDTGGSGVASYSYKFTTGTLGNGVCTAGSSTGYYTTTSTQVTYPLTNGTCAMASVATNDVAGNQSAFVDTGWYGMDTTAPGGVSFTQPSGDQTTFNLAYSWAWNAAVDPVPASGIWGYYFTLQNTAATNGVCGTTWNYVYSGQLTANVLAYTWSPMSQGYCYRLQVRSADNAGNSGPTITSGNVLVSSGLSACVSYAAPTTCTINRDGEYDVRIQNGSGAGTNYWNQGPQLGKSGGVTYRTVMYFPHAALPDGAQITSATLTVFGYTPSQSGSTIKISRLLGSWTKTGVTWNNTPAADPVGTGSLYMPFNWNSWMYMSTDVTGLVREMYSKNSGAWRGDFGFLLQNADETTDASQLPSYYPGNPNQGANGNPILQIAYTVPGNNIGFDTASGVGPNFAPSTLPAGGSTVLPVKLTNNSTVNTGTSGSSFVFPRCQAGVTDCYKVGYRWFTAAGTNMAPAGLSGTADLSADLPAGQSATVNLPVSAPVGYAGDTLSASGIAGYWRLNDGPGATGARDAVGQHDGRYVGACTGGGSGPVTGDPAAGSVAFNGSSCYVTTAGWSTTSGTYTVEAWAKPATTSGSTVVISTRGPSDYTFDLQLSGGTQIHGDIGNGTSWLTTAADASFTYTAGTWYHIVYVVTPKGYTIYANGSQVGSGSFSGTPLLADATHNLFIGEHPNGSYYFNGSIADVAIYSVPLSPTQVSAHYAEAISGTGAIGSYTLRLDLVHVTPAGPAWGSDGAYPDKYTSRTFASDDTTNSRMIGSSPIQRAEFSVGVVSGAGSGVAETKTVRTGDGGTVGVSLYTKNLVFADDTGLAVPDVGTNLGVSYYYNSKDTGFSGILGASGWGTNWDEQITAPAAGNSYSYRDPQGNIFTVSAGADGAYSSVGAERFERVRYTWYDEQVLPAGNWFGTAPTVSTAQSYNNSGHSLAHSGSDATGTFISNGGSPIPVHLNQYPMVNFAVRTSAGNGAAMAYYVVDYTTGTGNWIVYTVGSSWSTGYGPIASINLTTTSPLNNWVVPQDNLLTRVRANLSAGWGAKAAATDDFGILMPAFIAKGSGGTDYYDNIFFSPATNKLLDDTDPTWGTGSYNVASETSDVAAGSKAYQVTPCDPSDDFGYPSVNITPVSLSANAYMAWSWKKAGGGTVGIRIGVRNDRTNDYQTITYYAGPIPPDRFALNPIQVSSSAPSGWTRVTKNVLEDARQLFHWTAGNTSDPASGDPGTTIAPKPDPVSITDYWLLVYDGSYARFDAIDLQSAPDVPGNINANTYNAREDFVLVGANNVRHIFNQDGRLVRVVDASGNATSASYTYNYSSSGGPAAYSLSQMAGPSNGGSNLDGTTAARNVSVTGIGSGTVTFTENIGASGDTGRKAVFTTSSGDLTSVSPARNVTGTCASGSPTGCVKFDYTGSHLLAHVYDPRGDGTTANANYETIGWSSGAPTSITEGASSTVFRILSWNTTPSAAVARPEWQKDDEIAVSTNGFAHYTGIDPNGQEIADYRPIPCTQSNCSGGTTSPASPVDMLSTSQYDGLANMTASTQYRLAGNLAPVVTRRATFARAIVDNLPDPITGSETAWIQSADQYLASLIAGDPSLYRTSYVYDGWGNTTDVITPYTLPQATRAYAAGVTNDPNVVGYWRLNDGSGTAADSSSGGHNGTYSGGYSLSQPGAITGDSTNAAVSFNGSTGFASIPLPSISGTYSLEAWVKPASFSSDQSVLSTFSSTSTSTFNTKILAGGTKLRTYVAYGIASQTSDVKYTFTAGNWYHLVYSFSSGFMGEGQYVIYINGTKVDSGPIEGAPMPFSDSNHPLSIGQSGLGTEYFNGSVDEVSLYKRALIGSDVQNHYLLGHAAVNRDVVHLYDAAGREIQDADNSFIANSSFDLWQLPFVIYQPYWGLSGDDQYAGASYDTTTANTGLASLKLTGTTTCGVVTGATGCAWQETQLLPGQTFRFQVATKATTGSARWKMEYQQASTGTWAQLLASQADGSTTWTNHAANITVPQDGNGAVRVQLYVTGSDTANFDDVVVMTKWVQNTYNANGTQDTTIGLDPTASSGVRVTKLDYGDPHGTGYAAANAITNGGFTSGQSSWTVEGSGTFATLTSDATYTIRDGEVSGYNSTSGPWGTIAALTLPASTSGDIAQTVSASAGTTYSASALVGETNLTAANLGVSYLDGSGNVLATYTSSNSTRAGGTDRGAYAYLTVTATAPAGTTQLKLTLNGTGNASGGTLRADAISVVTGSIPQPYLPSQKVPQGVFASKTTANYVSGGGSSADQNVASVTVYDRWGRGVVAIDPDGISTMVGYAPNGIDIAAKSDGLGDVTRTTSWDAVGNPLTSLDPAGNPTSTTYGYSNLPVDITTPDGKVSHTDYNVAHQAIHMWTNYVGGGSPKTDVRNVETTKQYDEYGQATRTITDDGGAGATNDKTYDLLGNVLTTTLYPSGTSGGRTTTSYFATVSYGGTVYSAGKESGTALPMAPSGAPAPLCPGSSSARCDAVNLVDANGQTTSSIDAFGKIGVLWYDFDGRPVRTVANYVAGGGSTADQNAVTTTQYDLRGRTYVKTDPLGHTTTKTYDHLDRPTKTAAADGSWTRTDYTAAGRTLQTSLTGGSSDTDNTVSWTSTVYDGAGRAIKTLSNHDRSGAIGYATINFEANTTQGFATGRAYSLYPAASLGLNNSSARTGAYSLNFTTDAAHGSSEGVFAPLGGSLHASDTYGARLYAYSATATTISVYVGDASGESAAAPCSLAAGTWTACTLTGFGAGGNGANGYVKVTAAASSAITIDAVSVWDTTPTLPTDVPSITVPDVRGLVVASIVPPGHAGDAPLVTTTGYDNMGRTTSVTVDAIAGGGTSASDVNLTTSYTYDDLSHRTDTTDPTGVITHVDYDRLGRMVDGIANYVAGQGTTSDQNVKATSAYNNIDEVIGTCEPAAVAAGCNPANTSDALAWHYTYDANGHVLTQVPPVNTVNGAADSTGFVYDTATHTRIVSTCLYPAGGSCSTAHRHADITSYDNVGRVLTTTTYVGSGTGTVAMTTTNAYDAVGNKLSVAFNGAGSSEGTDTLTFDFDSLNRLLDVKRGGTAISATAYNLNGTVASRTDPAGTSNFSYDGLQRLTGTTGPTYSGSAGYTWRLDGLVDTRTWPGGMAAATFTYDGAKRPTGETIGTLASFTRTYDRAGNATSETQTLSGISGLAGAGTQNFKYDHLSRVTCAYFGADNCSSPSGTTETYAYDLDSNRTSWNNGGVVTAYAYDRLDQLETATTSSIVHTFAYDAYGNLTSETITGDTQAPTAPSNLVANATAFDVVSLTWTAATDNVGVSRYAVYRGGTLLALVDGGTTSFTDRSTAGGTAYSYTVSAIDAVGGESAQTAPAGATTPTGSLADTTAPTVPGTPVVGSVTGATIALSWAASTDADTGVQGYKVFRDGTQIGTVPIGTTSFVDTGLAASTGHAYTVGSVDGAGNASAVSAAANGSTTAVLARTSYAYDTANRLTGIVEADGTSVGFTIDALGRHSNRTANGATIDAYSYIGLDDVVVRDQTASGTVDSAIDGLNARIAIKTSTGFGWVVPDLHGNVAGMANANGSVLTDAFRYDAYGRTIGSVTSSLPTLWRFQGKILESTPGQQDVYDFVSRSYAPDLGMFLQFDSVAGSSQNPITLNRYLYAGANPETLTDPDGHCWGICIDINPIGALQSAAGAVGNAAGAVGEAAKAVAPVVASVAASTAVAIVTSTGPGAAAFIAVSTVAGAAGAAASDVASGHFPDIKHVAAGAVAGATFGVVYSVTKNFTAAGAASGAAGDAFTQTWEIIDGSRQGYDLGELGQATALGAVGGYIGGRIAARLGGRGSANADPEAPQVKQGPDGRWRTPDGRFAKAPEGATPEGPTKSSTYDRPSSYRSGVRDKTWDLNKGPDGQVRDPGSGAIMDKNEPWDMGHKPGWEFWKQRLVAALDRQSRRDFLDDHNDPSHYRPELPATNRGHTLEAPAPVNYWRTRAR